MNNNKKTRYNNKFDLELEQSYLEELIKDNVDFSNKDLIIITENGVEKVKVEEVLNELNKMIDLKKSLFSKKPIDEITDDEYNDLLNKYYDSLETEKYTLDENITKRKYPNINFNNLDRKSLEFLTSGDFFYKIATTNNYSGDFGPIIMQWCRAVELELRNKIYKYLNNRDAKIDISERSMETSFYKNGIRNNRFFKKLEVKDMMGFYDAMKNYDMTDYIYNKYIKPHYDSFSYEDFNKMIDYIKIVNNYRDSSAHSTIQIVLDKTSADKCKEYIVASKMILEILSNAKQK